MDKETLYMMALTRVPKLNYSQQRMLVETLGSATAVYENRHNIMDAFPDATTALKENLAYMDSCCSLFRNSWWIGNLPNWNRNR